MATVLGGLVRRRPFGASGLLGLGLAVAFWACVGAQFAVGRPSGVSILAGNLLLVGSAGAPFGYVAARHGTALDAAEPSTRSTLQESRRVVGVALTVVLTYLGLGIVAHNVAFGWLSSPAEHGIVYPVAVGRWLFVQSAVCLAAVLVGAAVGSLARRIE